VIDPQLPSADFEREFGEPLRRVLDLDTWHPGSDLPALYERLDAEIQGALFQERRVADALRAQVFPVIRDRSRPGAPPLAGVWPIPSSTLRRCIGGRCSLARWRRATARCSCTTPLP